MRAFGIRCTERERESNLCLKSHTRHRGVIIGFCVFFLCACTGIIAGGYIKQHIEGADAASSNITVTNNNQVVAADQGTSTITRTSTVTVKDASATLGYRLSARVSTNSIPGSTVKIGSSASTICPLATPCTITSSTTPVLILDTNNTNATAVAGETTDWTVTVAVPANTSLGNYMVDVEYSEEAIVPPPTLSDMTYLQDLAIAGNENVCANTPDRTRVTLRDRRNNQQYYVEKINGSASGGNDACWMETNLRYAGDGSWDPSWNYPDDRYATTASNTTDNPNDDARPLTLRSSGTASYTVAEYINPGGSTDYTNTNANGGFYGYLYNWCTAMGGQANACNDTSTAGFDTTVSICPAGWRLPTGGGQNAAIYDFESLFNAVGAAQTAVGSTNFRNNFLAVYAGYYYMNFQGRGSSGYYLTSTGGDRYTVGTVWFDATGVVHDATYKQVGNPVRCLL